MVCYSALVILNFSAARTMKLLLSCQYRLRATSLPRPIVVEIFVRIWAAENGRLLTPAMGKDTLTGFEVSVTVILEEIIGSSHLLLCFCDGLVSASFSSILFLVVSCRIGALEL